MLYDEYLSTSNEEWDDPKEFPVTLVFKCLGCSERIHHALNHDRSKQYARRHGLRTCDPYEFTGKGDRILV